jgi:hypothetical protein
MSLGEAKDSAMNAVGRGTPECPLTVDELRIVRKPGDTVTTASGYEVKVVRDETGKLLFQSRSLNETATSVCQPILLEHGWILISTVECSTVFM